MCLNELFIGNFGECGYGWPYFLSFVIYIIAVVLFASVIVFLQELWTNNESNSLNIREIAILCANKTNELSQTPWRRWAKSQGRDSTSETSSTQPTPMKTKQSTKEWENFVPSKYLYTSNNSYSARKPIPKDC